MHRPLVVLCAGLSSLHICNRWDREDLRDFDLWIVWYDACPVPEHVQHHATRVFTHTGPKWDLLRALPSFTVQSWVWFPDDDLAIDVVLVNAFFKYLSTDPGYRGLAQPSLAPRNTVYPVLVNQPNAGTPCRDVDFIELQMPCVSAALLSDFFKILHDNPGNKSGWGMDDVWSNSTAWPGVHKIVVDAVMAVHTRPTNTNSGFYKKFEIDPEEDKKEMLEKYGVTSYFPHRFNYTMVTKIT